MGEGHPTRGSDRDPAPRRRRCFMKGCEQRFTPLAGEQRFCGTVACRTALERWAAGAMVIEASQAEGYGQRRCARPGCTDEFSARSPTHRYCSTCAPIVAKDRARARQTSRRQRAKGERLGAQAEGTTAAQRPPQPTQAGRHAPGDPCQSLGRCQRPGCYEPRQDSPRRRALYCGSECARAVRRVLDRERKWRRLVLLRREQRRSAVIEPPARAT